MATTSFVIGLGSNRRHGRHGNPARILSAAIDALRTENLAVRDLSRTIRTPALGPAGRDFANAAILIETDLGPPDLLALLKRIERRFGRRRGRRWGARVIDLDILAWSRGGWRSPGLAIPHAALPLRRFALSPAAEIAPQWRHPRHGLTLRQLEARLRKARPVDRHPSGQ
jgi:2-amino-4-hydroxy-6-hydroxymethyldihydropteridine diphosphokinase